MTASLDPFTYWVSIIKPLIEHMKVYEIGVV